MDWYCKRNLGHLGFLGMKNTKMSLREGFTTFSGVKLYREAQELSLCLCLNLTLKAYYYSPVIIYRYKALVLSMKSS